MEYSERLSEITDALVNASTTFDVWRDITNANNQSRYQPVVEEYPVFFETLAVAHLIAWCVSLYSLYETRGDSNNIPQLIKHLEQEGTANSECIEEIRNLAQAARPAWLKISTIRNEALGHRSQKQSAAAAFQKAGITPNEVAKFIEESKVIVTRLAKAGGLAAPSVLELEATEETQLVMARLAEDIEP